MTHIRDVTCRVTAERGTRLAASDNRPLLFTGERPIDSHDHSCRASEPTLVLFGCLLTLLSSFWQTFFIGLFSRELRESLGLGDGAFGTIFSVATLASAVSMLWAGALIDRIPLVPYAIGSIVIVSAGYFLLPFAPNGLVLALAVALFLLRFGGQGLLSHTATTSKARYFHQARGRASSLATLGHPAGEAMLPPLAVLLAENAGWHVAWVVFGMMLLAAMPLLLRLCGTVDQRDVNGAEAKAGGSDEPDGSTPVLRDPAFYLFLPAAWMPGLILTGVFIHQARLMEQKGWPVAWFAASFTVFAAVQAAGMFGIGPIIDRVSARRLMPFYLLPFGFVCLALAVAQDKVVLTLFMAGAGLTAGIGKLIVTATWAEIYRVARLGAIRACSVSGAIVSTALAPPLFGWLIDEGMQWSSVLGACAGTLAVASALAYGGRMKPVQNQAVPRR